MSKAEEFAYSKYPKSKKGVLYALARNSIIQGYHQAEKDLELGWEDISIIKEILCGIVGYPLVTDKEICTEVLNRFKKGKG